jgi:hypothetical protein
VRALEDTAVAFHRACLESEVAYAVIGGFAVSTWGQPRATSDIDALLDVRGPDAIPPLVEKLKAEALSVSAQDLLDALRDGSHVTVFDEETSFHVDIKLARTAHERAQVAEAIQVPFHGAHLRVARAEDTIAYKLRFGSEQDLKDARSILVRRQGALDMARLDGLARRLGVEPVLAQVMREIEEAR